MKRLKTGKLAPKWHHKTLPFGRYLTGAFPEPASKVYREYKIPQGAKLMYGNDEVGDCTCAAAANDIILKTVHSGAIVIPMLEDVLDMYSDISDYDPATKLNDNGCAMTDVLQHLVEVGLGGRKILGWIQIDHTDALHRKLAVDLFGSTYVGVQVPNNMEDQFDANQPWEAVDNDGGIEGGHCILRTGYGSDGDNYVSWARWDQKASNAWSAKYIDEEYVILTQDWINQATKKTPGGLDLETLLADLQLLKG